MTAIQTKKYSELRQELPFKLKDYGKNLIQIVWDTELGHREVWFSYGLPIALVDGTFSAYLDVKHSIATSRHVNRFREANPLASPSEPANFRWLLKDCAR